MTLRIGSVCSGYEGIGMAVRATLGGEVAWVADNDPGAAAILAHRFPYVPNLGDITKVDWSEVEPVDVLCAGTPCQDISAAGKRAGMRKGTRSGLWLEVVHAIRALRPQLVVFENVRGLLTARGDDPTPEHLAAEAARDTTISLLAWLETELSIAITKGDRARAARCRARTARVMGLRKRAVARCQWHERRLVRAIGTVLGSLASLGYDARWTLVSASDVGAPHRRERVFLVAWPAADSKGVERGRISGEMGGPAGISNSQRPLQERHPVVGGRSTSTEDPNSTAGGERRLPAPGQAPGGRPRADAGRPGGARASAFVPSVARGVGSNAAGDGRDEGRTGPAGVVWRPDAARRGHDDQDSAAADTPDGGWHALHHGGEPGAHEPEPGGRDAPLEGDDRGGRLTAANAECDRQPGRPAGSPGATDQRREGPWAEAPGCGTDAPADPERNGLEGQRGDTGPGPRRPAKASWGLGPARGDLAAADAERGAGGRRTDLEIREQEGRAAAGRDRPAATPDPSGSRLGQLPGDAPAQEAGPLPGDEPSGDRGPRPAVNWGPYEAAIRRWEQVLGRPAPRPVEPGRTGERLSPRFVEWLMGLPEGWVTGVPGLTRNDQLKALGNGVVPQQGALALSLLLPEIFEAAA